MSHSYSHNTGHFKLSQNNPEDHTKSKPTHLIEPHHAGCEVLEQANVSYLGVLGAVVLDLDAWEEGETSMIALTTGLCCLKTYSTALIKELF